MKMDLEPLKPYVAPAFRSGDQPLDPELRRRVRRPIIIGSIVVGVFVFGLIAWAAVASISSAVVAPGVVRVEANRKVIRHREGGTVRAIDVHEGQLVKAGQPLLMMDDVQARTGVDVYQNQVDTLTAQNARYQAEATDRSSVTFPASLTSRMSDPRVAGLIRDQELLFTTRAEFYQSQRDVMGQRLDQLQTQIGGVQVQVDALDDSVRLTNEELAGYQTLYEKGYAPKTLILRYQRSLSDLAGRRGALTAEMNRLRQQMGETRMTLGGVRDQRVSQAAEGLRETQTNLSDATPRLTAARQTLSHTIVRSPVNGYVLDLSQFTVGGVVGQGEHLMDIVPSDAPLVVTVQIKPQDIDDVQAGMMARVRLTAFNYRKVSPVMAKVVTVSADQIVDAKSGTAYFKADLHIAPSELSKLPKGAKLTPGMPAQAMIVTGKKTILSYLVGPLTDTIRDSMHED
jgi:HlyD family secretion protein